MWTRSLRWCTTNEPRTVAQVMGPGFSAPLGRERQEKWRRERRKARRESKEIMTEPSTQANGNCIFSSRFLVHQQQQSLPRTLTWQRLQLPNPSRYQQWGLSVATALKTWFRNTLSHQKSFLLNFSTVPNCVPHPCQPLSVISECHRQFSCLGKQKKGWKETERGGPDKSSVALQIPKQLQITLTLMCSDLPSRGR